MSNQDLKNLEEKLKNYINAIDQSYMKTDQNHTKKETDKIDEFIDKFYSKSDNKWSTQNDQSDNSGSTVITAAKEFNEFIDVLKSIKFEADVIPYTDITRIVFENSQEELKDIIKDRLDKNWSHYLKNVDNNASHQLKRNFLKIKEHIGLSTLQKDHVPNGISDEIVYYEKRIDNMNESIEEFETKLAQYQNDYSKMQNELKDTYDKVITQFISILGIFAAILMGAFGSIHSFTSIFNNAHRLPIGNVLVISSIGASGVIVIIFFLLHGMSKIIGREISSCKCKEKKKASNSFFKKLVNSFNGKDDSNVCNCSVVERYPVVIITHYLLYFIMITGFAIIYLDNNSTFDSAYTNSLPILANIFLFYLFSIMFLLSLHNMFATKPRDKSLIDHTKYKTAKLFKK
ncbi:hypothetical protein SAMN05421734_102258 [Pelagirhabdus alkalitolerans]|uniref:Uncharacterized protein n=1 Tax=Pelagirhabdus alkalitolerans TaxID=1612202 RepID=A0A1G6H5K0_9BACI|nr:hypothetical protein [Pelagirhabdus alkalitolerans]SDB89481.1 hypothetical protein SAMN05421734_102258 [Pelagirhabdus alkalitolerans]